MGVVGSALLTEGLLLGGCPPFPLGMWLGVKGALPEAGLVSAGEPRGCWG